MTQTVKKFLKSILFALIAVALLVWLVVAFGPKADNDLTEGDSEQEIEQDMDSLEEDFEDMEEEMNKMEQEMMELEAEVEAEGGTE